MAQATRDLVAQYRSQWALRGYPEDLPDEVPHELMKRGLAPSYQAIALALLNNDMGLTALGFQPPHSRWYDAIKRVEIEERNKHVAETNKDVATRIEELRSQGVSWGDVAKQLNTEGMPSLSGKPWSQFMAMNYQRPTNVGEPKKTAQQHRIEILETMLMQEIMKNIELQARLASLN